MTTQTFADNTRRPIINTVAIRLQAGEGARDGAFATHYSSELSVWVHLRMCLPKSVSTSCWGVCLFSGCVRSLALFSLSMKVSVFPVCFSLSDRRLVELRQRYWSFPNAPESMRLVQLHWPMQDQSSGKQYPEICPWLADVKWMLLWSVCFLLPVLSYSLTSSST